MSLVPPKIGIKQRRRIKGKSIANLPTKSYDPRIMADIIERVGNGEAVTVVLLDNGMPSRFTFYNWLARDPEALRLYEQARELSAQSFEDELIVMARELKNENKLTALRTDQYKTAMAQFRWSATRRDPKRFAERRDTQVVVPVQINTTLDLGGNSLSTPEHPNVFHLEAVISDDPPDPDPDLWPEDGPNKPKPLGRPHLPPPIDDPSISPGARRAAALAQSKGMTVKNFRGKLAAKRKPRVPDADPPE